MRSGFLILLSAALVAACGDSPPAPPADADGANDAATMPGVPGMPAVATGEDATYLAQAGAGDLFEIESSRAILARTDDPGVKDFAQKMIDAHKRSTETLTAAAKDAGLTVSPPVLAPEQQGRIDAINAASGDAAVKIYVAAQREAHDAALALHQDYARDGATPALKTAAGDIAATVRHHIDMLAKLPGA